ncbi:SDR family NAD(P)-dependent oxidoreductase [Jongsikchunia kroppenstedtii]|uniref:SDR family NAD(P)-dependent oxidoreductase n=1 Tax=Jongsikchunia kroppenstedtii TaxID=1121721 RepID=UPI000378335A|nr:SDR family oxidoreductase [Jongsikchunia kroppenstedtii]
MSNSSSRASNFDGYFRGKVAVVTGAGSGMGRELAIQLAKGGAKVAISDVVPAALDETRALVEASGAQVHSQLLNVAEREAVLDYAKTVAEHFGVINLIFNNAGINHHGPVTDTTFKDYDRVMDIDFWGVVNGTKAFLPYLIESGDGHVVNTSSLFGIMAQPDQSAYNAAKFAVRGFTEALRQEMLIAKHPVKVTCVHPGGVKTNIVNWGTVSEGSDGDKLKDLFNKQLARMSAEDAATVILNGTRRHKARVLVGADAKAIDLLVRATGSGYQRVVTLASSRLMGGK